MREKKGRETGASYRMHTAAGTLLLRSTRHLQGVEMSHHLVDMHDVGVFVMQIEQIDLVSELGAIEGAFLDQGDVKTVGVTVDHARPHATRGAFAAHDQAMHADEREVRKKRGALEDAGALLPDHDIR